MPPPSRGGPAPRLPTWGLILVGVAAVVALAVVRLRGGGGGGGGPDHERIPTAPVPPLPAPAPAPDRPHVDRPNVDRPSQRPADPPPHGSAIDVEGIGDADEQAAILEVARAIDRGGPFAYRKDGVTFENREGRLPPHRRGHWREYTVPTPGSPDRGARRIIAGADGELFYTRDHYRTFRRIRGPT